jgi:hypothetical protein
MSYTDVERLWKLPLNHREKLLLLYILLRGVCYAKTATQIEETGLSRTRFYRLRKQLHTDGYIEKLDRTDPRVPPTAPEDCDDIYRACPERWEALRQSHRRTSSVPQAHLLSPTGALAYKEELHINNTGTQSSGAAEKRGRPADPAYARFAEEFKRRHEVQYMPKKGDFVQLAHLRKLLGCDTRGSPPDWDQAVTNYFDSQKGFYTLADLCTGYATYRQRALDRFKQPIGAMNANNTISTPDTRQDANIADAHKLLARIAAANRGGD